MLNPLRNRFRPVGPEPWGKKIVTRGGHKILVTDRDKRALMQFVVKLHDEKGKSFSDIVRIVDRMLCHAEGIPRRLLFKMKYSERQIRYAYHAEKRTQLEEAESTARYKERMATISCVTE